MSIFKLMLKEISHRKILFASNILAIVLASASLIGSVALLRIHDYRTSKILERKQAELEERMKVLQDDTRKAMLKLGFNIVILPKDQNLSDWYANDYANKYMPEFYVDTLANSGIITVRHFLPSLQQKVEWPEHKRKIILVGTKGEVPNLHKNPRKPMVQPVPSGTITLGYELHRSLDMETGDKIKLMGQEFVVGNTYDERGNKDDITAWIHLEEAQQLLDKPGLINAILALECLCTGPDVLPRLRKEITSILPGTQIIERGSRALARAEARTRVAEEARTALEEERQSREHLREIRERFASILTPVIMLACALWIALSGFMNVRSRRTEIGILRALGVPAKRILVLFMSKHIYVGVLGGLLGFICGVFAAVLFSSVSQDAWLWIQNIQILPLLLLSVIGATFLAVVAGWIPAVMAIQQDPAVVLREE
jgi:ABC-type lipoprotein release transport system permease subunit